MRRTWFAVVLFLVVGLLWLPGGAAWAGPPADTSIVTSDSHLVFDLTLEGRTVLQLAQPVYDPETRTRTSTLTLDLPSESLRVEAGYDEKGQVVLSSTRTGAPDLLSPIADQVGRFRWANDELAHFDEAGDPIPSVLPDDAVPLTLSSLVGPFKGASVTEGIVVTDLAALAKTGEVELIQGKMAVVTTKVDALDMGGTVVRTFVHQGGGVWVLESVEMTVAGESGSDTYETRHTLTFSNVSWHLNASQDAQRMSQRGEIDPIAPRDGFSTAALEPPAPGTAGMTGWPPMPDAAQPLASGNGQNVVFQHGGLSSPGTWARMDPWLSETFRFGTKILPQLDWTKRFDTQASDLINVLDSSGQNDFLMIGHSYGGVVSRRVGQSRPDLVRGVITISSPNNGMLLTLTPRLILAEALFNRAEALYSGCLSPFQDAGCFLAYTIATAVAVYVPFFGIDELVPSTGDVTPISPFIFDLNSTPESFPSVGINNVADQRWVLMRLAGDSQCNPEDACGGRALAAYSEAAYLFFRACEVTGIIRGNPNTAFWCGYIADKMNDIDDFWEGVSADSSGSDGIVNALGQVYLGANLRLTISGADSHVGENRSEKVRAALTSAMDSVFQVPRQGSQNPVPQILSIQPATAAAGSPPFTLTVRGNGLGTFSTIRIDGAKRPTRWDNQQRTLTASITAGDLSAPGVRTIQVFNAAPGGGLSNEISLTITGTGNNPVPSVTSVSPSTVMAGGAAFALTVDGFGFVQGAAVQINGSPRLTTFVSATRLQATVSASDIAAPATLLVRAANPAPGGGVSTTSAALTVTSNGSNPMPSATSLSPSQVTAGGPAFTLTVDGSGFVGSSVVRIDSNDRPTTFISATRLTATIPAADIASQGTRSVKVRNPAPGGGTSNGLTLTVNPQPPNPVPAITSISPASAAAGSSGFTLTVDGSGFVPASFVRWNGSQRPTTFVSATRLTAAITAADIAAAGSASVRVVNPAPGGGGSNTVSFTVQPPAQNPVPQVSSISPQSIAAGEPGFALTVLGSNFVSTSFVRWNGSPRNTVFVSPNQLTAAIGAADIAAAGSASVRVINPSPGGGGSNTVTFVVQAPSQNPLPQLTGIDPAQVTAGGPDVTLTISGSGFVPTSEVKAAGSRRATSYVSPTRLTSLIPAALVAVTGPVNIKVVNPAPGGGTSNELQLTVLPPPSNPVPVVTALDPAQVTAGGLGFTLNIYGEGFVSGSEVKVSGSRRTTTYVSPTQLAAQIPASVIASPGSATVKVLNPAPGGGSSNDFFLTILPPPSNPVPAISALSPASVVEGGPDFTLTVLGSGFVPSSTVKIGGNRRPTTFVSASQLAVSVLAADIAVAGSTTVKATNPEPGGGASNAVSLVITPRPPNPVPAIASISPSTVQHGGGDLQLTVTGSGFVPSSVVRINGEGRPTIFLSSTQLVATVFAGDIAVAQAATIKVRNPAPGGGTSNGVTLNVQ